MDTLLNQADTAIAKAKAHIDREIAILKSKKLLGGCELEEMRVISCSTVVTNLLLR